MPIALVMDITVFLLRLCRVPRRLARWTAGAAVHDLFLTAACRYRVGAAAAAAACLCTSPSFVNPAAEIYSAELRVNSDIASLVTCTLQGISIAIFSSVLLVCRFFELGVYLMICCPLSVLLLLLLLLFGFL